MRNLKTNQVWSNTYHPLGGPLDKYFVGFASDRAEMRRLDAGIETETEIIVASEDDMEIRRITLINRTDRPCILEVTSYAELALAQHAADRQHPAFNKLFIETETLGQEGALLATRRRRDVDEPTIWAMHMLVAKDTEEQGLQFETDRGRFIGRGRTPGSPAALYQNLSNTSGQVLDPVFSLRRTLQLEPGGRGEFYLLLERGRYQRWRARPGREIRRRARHPAPTRSSLGYGPIGNAPATNPAGRGPEVSATGRIDALSRLAAQNDGRANQKKTGWANPGCGPTGFPATCPSP